MATSFLANPTATKEALQKFGLATKHALGQNFLISDNVIEKILAFADLHPKDIVLEVGPGLGTLTVALLPRVKEVITIEKDSTLLDALREHSARALGEAEAGKEGTTSQQAATEALKVLEADALSVDLSRLDELVGAPGLLPTKFISNLPYEIAATIVLDAFQELPLLERAVVMLQREVAERMRAKPGSKIYGAYTVKLALWAHVADFFLVGRNNFLPAPHVDSAVVLIEQGAASPFCQSLSAAQKREVAAFVDAAFSQRRKQMLKVLAANGYNRERLEEIFSELKIDAKIRAEALSPEEFCHIFARYKDGSDAK